jgi:hypothetical protein
MIDRKTRNLRTFKTRETAEKHDARCGFLRDMD